MKVRIDGYKVVVNGEAQLLYSVLDEHGFPVDLIRLPIGPNDDVSTDDAVLKLVLEAEVNMAAAKQRFAFIATMLNKTFEVNSAS